MITEELFQVAICDQCRYKWQLQKVMPKKCRSCQSTKWNSFSQEPQKKELSKISTPLPLKEPQKISIEVPTESSDWIYLSDSYQDGEVLSWRKKPKGVPQCYKRTSDLSSA